MVKELASSGESSCNASTTDSSSLSRLHQLALSELSISNQIATLVPAIAIPESGESAKLSCELKAAVDYSSKVTLMMPPANTAGADLVIRRDGSIMHYLNMAPHNGHVQNLIIAVEDSPTAATPLSTMQNLTLRELLAYTHASDKEFSVELPTFPLKANARPTETELATNENQFEAPLNNPLSPRLLETHPTAPRIADGKGETHHPPVSRACLPERSTQGTVRTTTYESSQPRNWSQFDLFDLLTDWFDTDQDAFERLMPALHKKIAGANGKIDPKKLHHLIDSKDPMLHNLRSNLPHLAEAFMHTGQSHGSKHTSSGEAVNPTGAVLAEKAERVSEELASSGFCAKGVSFAIERATGKVIWGNANDMRKSLPEQGFTVAQSKELKVGQVVHVYWTPEIYAQEQARRGPCPNYGDIAVIGKGRDGQLYAYNDAATPLNDYLRKSRYDWNTLKVFNPPSA